MIIKNNKKKHMKKNIFIVLIILIIASCSQDSQRLMPASTGSPGHILIFMAEQKWEHNPGKIIRETFNKDFDILPQSEPIFDYSQVPTEAFSKLLKRTRNILYTQISINVKKPEVLVSYDKYASPQIIITVKAKDNKEFTKLFKKYKEKIVFSYEKAERNRLIKGYSGKLMNKNIKSILKKNHNLSLNVPKGYKLDVDSSNFVWLSRETPWSSQGILIWDYPYKDTSELHIENLLNKRDEITQKFIPGPVDSSYMTTERIIDPNYNEFLLNNVYTVRIKGLWKVAGAAGVFMGGPYVSITTVDQKRNRIVTTDGYIYGGKKKKRELVRQVEAILYTLKIKE